MRVRDRTAPQIALQLTAHLAMFTRMWYAIRAYDAADSLSLRQQNRESHLRRLNQLCADGRLLVAGPLPALDQEDPGPAGFSGSLVIAEFESLQAAREWAEADPYREAGVYERVDVQPFKAVLP